MIFALKNSDLLWNAIKMEGKEEDMESERTLVEKELSSILETTLELEHELYSMTSKKN